MRKYIQSTKPFTKNSRPIREPSIFRSDTLPLSRYPENEIERIPRWEAARRQQRIHENYFTNRVVYSEFLQLPVWLLAVQIRPQKYNLMILPESILILIIYIQSKPGAIKWLVSLYSLQFRMN